MPASRRRQAALFTQTMCHAHVVFRRVRNLLLVMVGVWAVSRFRSQRAPRDEVSPMSLGEGLYGSTVTGTHSSRWRNWIALSAIALVTSVAFWQLMPGSVPRPELVPVDLGATTNNSEILLVGTNGDTSSGGRLIWTWDSDGRGGDVAYVTASLSGPRGEGALIFAGPVTHALGDCTNLGDPASLSAGLPNATSISILEEVRRLDVYSRADVSYLALRVDSGRNSPYVTCEIGPGLAVADPPGHRVYTPNLRAVIAGRPKYSDVFMPDLCVERVVFDATTSSESNCQGMEGSAWLWGSLSYLERVDETWRRELRLMLLGVLLGLIAQVLWELVNGRRNRRYI